MAIKSWTSSSCMDPIIFSLISNWKNLFANKKNVTGISLEIEADELLKYTYLINSEIKNIGFQVNDGSFHIPETQLA